ncbi:MAG: hypothetical protein H0S85_01060 [Desulfovibrionaceae bacterium]|jgi:hypothetical protein|nr:hypothetical protein [Desulfovibrionaceae bacterium]
MRRSTSFFPAPRAFLLALAALLFSAVAADLALAAPGASEASGASVPAPRGDPESGVGSGEVPDALPVATIGEILRVMERAQVEIEAARGHGDAEGAARAAERYAAAECRLEQARIETLAKAASVPPREIVRMRASSLGWGRIARNLDVSPALLGVGRMNAKGDGSGQGAGNSCGQGQGKGQGQGQGKGQGRNK